MTYRATNPPLAGGFSAFRDFVQKEYVRIQRAMSTKAETGYGTFTPTIDFATTGDLSVSYGGVQAGEYWVNGNLLFFNIAVANATPTFTTSAGNFHLLGLPYPYAGSDFMFYALQMSAASITYTTGRTWAQAFISPNEDFLKIREQGDAIAGRNIQTSNITSGSSLSGIRVTGFYPFKYE